MRILLIPTKFDKFIFYFLFLHLISLPWVCNDRMYSNGHSEIIRGNAIKQLNLPRDKIVVMTKVCASTPFAPVSYYFDILVDIGILCGTTRTGPS